jgi:hypothetical protein
MYIVRRLSFPDNSQIYHAMAVRHTRAGVTLQSLSEARRYSHLVQILTLNTMRGVGR